MFEYKGGIQSSRVGRHKGIDSMVLGTCTRSLLNGAKQEKGILGLEAVLDCKP